MSGRQVGLRSPGRFRGSSQTASVTQVTALTGESSCDAVTGFQKYTRVSLLVVILTVLR